MKSDAADWDRALECLAIVLVGLRARLGLTQEDVAFAAGISVRHLQKLESGILNPSYAVLRSVAAVLKTPLATLLKDAQRLELGRQTLSATKKKIRSTE